MLVRFTGTWHTLSNKTISSANSTSVLYIRDACCSSKKSVHWKHKRGLIWTCSFKKEKNYIKNQVPAKPSFIFFHISDSKRYHISRGLCLWIFQSYQQWRRWVFYYTGLCRKVFLVLLWRCRRAQIPAKCYLCIKVSNSILRMFAHYSHCFYFLQK